MSTKRSLVSLPQLLVLGLVCAFAAVFVCRALGFSSFYLLTNPSYLPLKAIPAPPKTTDQSMNQGAASFDWRLVYHTNSPLNEVVGFYQEVLPQRGWVAEFRNPVATVYCIKATKNGRMYFVQVRQFVDESVARVDIHFPDTLSFCADQFK